MPIKSSDVMFKRAGFLLTFIFALALPFSAMAYVGPGAGITLVGALWAVIVAVVFMMGGLLAWPLRALLRFWKNSKTKEAPEADSGR